MLPFILLPPSAEGKYKFKNLSTTLWKSRVLVEMKRHFQVILSKLSRFIKIILGNCDKATASPFLRCRFLLFGRCLGLFILLQHFLFWCVIGVIIFLQKAMKAKNYLKARKNAWGKNNLLMHIWWPFQTNYYKVRYNRSV